MRNETVQICYLGIYRPTAPRDKVYFDGLKARGVEVLECVDNSAGFRKFWELGKKLFALRGRYDVLWVGYLSGMLVPLGWICSDKKVIWNALSSWYENAVLDRALYPKFSIRAFIIRLSDFLSFHLADEVLVESDAQKRFVARAYHVRSQKLHTIFTGADAAVFFPDPAVPKLKRFTVLFRGLFAPATGVGFVLEAAKLLRDHPIDFVIIGWGPLQDKVETLITECGLNNVKLITYFLEPKVLRETMLSCHSMLGQFGDHPRLDRTIQNKNFEALALGLPLITRDSRSNRELLEHEKNCLFIPKSAPQGKAIADAILRLRDHSALREKIAAGARATYESKLTPEILSAEVLQIIKK